MTIKEELEKSFQEAVNNGLSPIQDIAYARWGINWIVKKMIDADIPHDFRCRTCAARINAFCQLAKDLSP